MTLFIWIVWCIPGELGFEASNVFLEAVHSSRETQEVGDDYDHCGCCSWKWDG